MGWTGEMWRRGRIKRSDGAITPSLGDYRYYSFFDTLGPVGGMAKTKGDRSPKIYDTERSEKRRVVYRTNGKLSTPDPE